MNLELKDYEVHIAVDFERGAKLSGLPVHNPVNKLAHHLNFFKFPW